VRRDLTTLRGVRLRGVRHLRPDFSVELSWVDRAVGRCDAVGRSANRGVMRSLAGIVIPHIARHSLSGGRIEYTYYAMFCLVRYSLAVVLI